MKHLAFTLVFASALVATALAQSERARGYITWVQNGSSWNYDIHLTNTANTPIGTFWFSWVPGSGFLPHMPTNISGPSTWNSGVVTDTYSIQWIANTALSPGQTIDGFRFTSVDSPNVLAGRNNGSPVGTSFIYHAGPFSDFGVQIVVNPLPVPVTAPGHGHLLLLNANRVPQHAMPVRATTKAQSLVQRRKLALYGQR